MHPFPWVDLIVIAILVLLNGVLVMAEFAILQAKRARLKALVRNGKRGAPAALKLAEDPAKFLAAVQIGITLVAIISGAYSGETLAGPVAERLVAWGLVPARLGEEFGFALVIVLITYASLLVGELVPKQLAIRSAEAIAVATGPAMDWLTRLSLPMVWVMDQSSRAVFALLRQNREGDSSVTEEELKHVVEEAEQAGVIEEQERQMISGIMRLADRRVRGVMTPRGEVDWIDADADLAEIRAHLAATPHSRLPVARGTVDDIIGVIQARDVEQELLESRVLYIAALARPAPVLPDVVDAVDALAMLRDADIPMALVHDEYGHFEGVVTPSDLLAAIVGAFRSDVDDVNDPPLVERGDGSWLLSGALPADEMAETLGLELPDARDYETVAGFVLEQLRHLPATGEKFAAHGWQFEVIDMDGRRVDKVLAQPG